MRSSGAARLFGDRRRSSRREVSRRDRRRVRRGDLRPSSRSLDASASWRRLSRRLSLSCAKVGPWSCWCTADSGSGKSCLIQQFLDEELDPERRADLEGTMLRARVGPVQGGRQPGRFTFSRYLMSRPAELVSRVLPRDVRPLHADVPGACSEWSRSPRLAESPVAAARSPRAATPGVSRIEASAAATGGNPADGALDRRSCNGATLIVPSC